MILIPYDEIEHKTKVQQMLLSQNMDPAYADNLPHYSWIALGDGEPIAFGGIRMVEGGMGIMDSYLTNATASSELRNKALDWLTRHLILVSKHLNVTKLIAFSESENIFNRAKSHGFQEFAHKIGIISLK